MVLLLYGMWEASWSDGSFTWLAEDPISGRESGSLMENLKWQRKGLKLLLLLLLREGAKIKNTVKNLSRNLDGL